MQKGFGNILNPICTPYPRGSEEDEYNVLMLNLYMLIISPFGESSGG